MAREGGTLNTRGSGELLPGPTVPAGQALGALPPPFRPEQPQGLWRVRMKTCRGVASSHLTKGNGNGESQ